MIGDFITLTFSISVEVEDVQKAVENELKGPGKLLGYRAMHRILRQEYDLNVIRDQVYHVMSYLDPEGVEARMGIGAGKKRQKGNFTTRGSNWVHSLDGHDKLSGYQNSNSHWLSMAALTQQVGNFFGCKSGHQTVIPKWLDGGISIIFTRQE